MKPQSLCILGRQPSIGLAELMSLYGNNIQFVSKKAALIDCLPTAININRLGGTIKLCLIKEVLASKNWAEIQQTVLAILSAQINELSAGKITLGISVYNSPLKITQIMAMGLSIKKTLHQNGRSIRLVPNVTSDISSAQVIHNHLTKNHGIEIVICCDNHRTILAQTVAIQDIESYGMRDYNRPKRDARVGMLPPKLAQIMINLATCSLSSSLTLLDPFCGTGVILQEALLMGYRVYGSDINPKMIDYTKTNLDWLRLHFNIATNIEPVLEVQNATTAIWNHHFDVVVSELFLGPPLIKSPAKDELVVIRRRCDEEIERFLRNISRQVPPKTQLCIAVPAWQVANGQFIRLSCLDHLGQLGYNQRSFEHLEPTGLIYARANQIVARELLIITRK